MPSPPSVVSDCAPTKVAAIEFPGFATAGEVQRQLSALKESMSVAGYEYDEGATYQLLQYHFHSPSEHTVSGQRYDMELGRQHNVTNLNRKGANWRMIDLWDMSKDLRTGAAAGKGEGHVPEGGEYMQGAYRRFGALGL